MTEAEEIEKVMADLGFEAINTGGGCTAYQLILSGGDPDDPPHILVTEDSSVPETWSASVVVGKHATFDDPGETEVFPSVRELVDAIREGRSRLVPRLGAESPPPAISPARGDVETIDAHRRRLGMPPIDTAAGWTEQELREMAESIRATGRMSNPQHLKRRLMRLTP